MKNFFKKPAKIANAIFTNVTKRDKIVNRYVFIVHLIHKSVYNSCMFYSCSSEH